MAYIKTGLTGGGSGVTLNVTCEEDFLGEILTLSDGTTTLTSIVPSSLSVVFDITESGTWTLTNSLTSESIPFYIETEYNATLTAIPDGKTVLPTDDIQIWLKCASINNKSYTTLAEVLNDEAVLCTLMATDNAVDYLVRSTTWAVGTVLTPTMTSNTTPEGMCIRRSVGDSSYEAWKAFDGDESTRYLSVENVAGEYVGYVFAAPIKAFSCEALLTTNSSNYCNQTVKVQASNDNFTTAVDLTDSFTFSTRNTDPVVRKKFTFNSNIGEYSAYRILRTDSYLRFVVHEIYFRSASITDSETAMKYIGASDYASYTLLSDSTWFTAINNSIYKDYLINTSVPTMTGYTTPAGEVIYSNEYSSKYLAWYAFDKGSNGQWEPSGMTGNYIGYDFKKNVSITNFSYQGATGQYASWSFKDFKLQGSNDNTNWYDVEDFTYTSLGNVQSFVLNTGSDIYNSFRLYCVNGNGGTDGCATEVQLYGHEYGGVQTWLRAAGITNKLYTSLSEVLNDSATLSTLMANEDAVDYLVTAKSWINSKELVPTMTSNTTPSGTCFGKDKYGSQDYYYAFDKNDTTAIHSSNYSSTTDWYIGYKFDTINDVGRVDYVFSQAQSTAITFTVKVQSSMDGITWVDASDVKTLSISAGSAQKVSGSIDLTSNCQATWFRIYTNGIGVTVFSLQFCATSITESESAMELIGLNNYASNTLLADEDWSNGICNSTYFESVLNVKVPVMTSNTTPEGECSESSIYSNDNSVFGAWRAFDGNDIGTSPLAHTQQLGNGWIEYKFTDPVVIKKVYYKGQDSNWSSRNPLGYLQGSNDGTTYDNIKAIDYRSMQIVNDVIFNFNSYNRYRLYNSSSSAEYLTAATIQFYGRKDI